MLAIDLPRIGSRYIIHTTFYLKVFSETIGVIAMKMF